MRPFLLTLFLATTASAQFSIALGPIEANPESMVGVLVATVTNRGTAAATAKVNARVVGADLIAAEPSPFWTCAFVETAAQLECRSIEIAPQVPVELKFYVKPAHERRITVQAATGHDIAYRVGVFYRRIFVTNTNDSGPSSLREAIHTVNTACDAAKVPRAITFEIPGDAAWQTIAPQTPLPAITGRDVLIDGASQTVFGGDTNPLGPEIQLDGSDLVIGNGLEVAQGSGDVIIRHLAVGGFPWNGLLVRSAPIVEENYIGTDATGLRALPNGSRGIAVDESGFATIQRNVISGNARSGIYVSSSAGANIYDNRIGTNRDGGLLPNGASGIFFDAGTYGSEVLRNRIAYNRHFGVGMARAAAHLVLDENSIAHNELTAIDRGLDGIDPFPALVFDDFNTGNAKIPPPRILSAVYDVSTNTTTIEGLYFGEIDRWGMWRVTLYANDVPEREGDVVLGKAVAPRSTPEGEAGAFRLTVTGDLRGKSISAIGNRFLNAGWSGTFYWTSEFSEVVAVK